jgi:hypothetical protein
LDLNDAKATKLAQIGPKRSHAIDDHQLFLPYVPQGGLLSDATGNTTVARPCNLSEVDKTRNNIFGRTNHSTHMYKSLDTWTKTRQIWDMEEQHSDMEVTY